MKILFITHYSELYGANKSLLGIIDGLGSKIEPQLLTPVNGQIINECINRNIKYYIRPFEISFVEEKKTAFYKPFLRLKYLPRLIKVVYRNKPDIIYSNSSVIDYGIYLSLLFKIPHIWHIREFGISDYNVTFDGGGFFFQKLLKKSTQLIAISKSIQKEILFNISSNLIYNGVVSKLNIAKSAKKYTNNFRFGIVGLIHPNKKQEEAIKAIKIVSKKYPDIRLQIIGNGADEYIKYLKKLLVDLNIRDLVDFTGFISSNNQIYSNINVLLMCSEKEALGRVTIEAMSFGIPVIGKNSGGTPEIITHKYNGLLYDNDENDLAQKITELIDKPEEYEKYSKNAIQTVKNSFTIEKYAENIYNILVSL